LDLRLTHHLFSVGCSIGVNRDASEVSAALARGVLNVVQGDATQLPVESSSADAVLAVSGNFTHRERVRL
jgi:ubiquinone/menaquinone biosynthesis C-methylase UbiE